MGLRPTGARDAHAYLPPDAVDPSGIVGLTREPRLKRAAAPVKVGERLPLHLQLADGRVLLLAQDGQRLRVMLWSAPHPYKLSEG